jgi:Glycosyl hydrolases family 2, TIM barrel domain
VVLKNRIALFICLLCIPFGISAKEKPKKPFHIFNPGTEFPVRYEKYGRFSGLGTNNYKYKITDRAGLGAALGQGIYPNNAMTMLKDPKVKKWNKERRSRINPWEYVNSGDPQTDFYAWGQSNTTNVGTRLFYIGQALMEAGNFEMAVKAYHAILVQFPRDVCWAQDNSFVWYPASEALSRVESITIEHPELGVRLKGAVFNVANGNDTDLKNDVFTINPGQWVPYTPGKNVDLKTLKITGQRGDGKVRLIQYENKHWQLLVDNKPFVIHGMTYSPTRVGVDIAGVANRWMYDDKNENGRIDTAYDSWIDINKNNTQDENERAVGDFELMKRMGVNAIRLYQNAEGATYDPEEFNKELLRDLQSDFGISVIMGHFLGAYTVGSGADWEEGTDYTDPVQLENMKQSVKEYVMDHKDEPYVLLWLLGNENLMASDYSGVNATRTKASIQVAAYLKFVNEVATMIHRIDPNHPVAVGNLDLIRLEEHAKYALAVDIFGTNAYRGSMGFGNVFKRVQDNFDRPVLITEYGCDAYNTTKDIEDEEGQATYHEGSWKSIRQHLAGGAEEGNAIGGVVFEFLDEWWKSRNGPFKTHETTKDSPMAFPDGWSSEEWLGVFAQGDGSESPFLRQPRKVFALYRDKLWKGQR